MSKELREARDFDVFSAKDEDSYIVDGYITTWDPYVVNYRGIQCWEQIDPHAFDDCDFSDTCFRIDHKGTVYARTRNNTIIDMHPDSHGFHCTVDLGKTAGARDRFEEIKNGMYDRMSQLMLVGEDEYDPETNVRHIKKIDKLFDIAAVAFPANDGTSIEARSAFWDGVISKREEAERLQSEKEKLKLKLKLMEI